MPIRVTETGPYRYSLWRIVEGKEKFAKVACGLGPSDADDGQSEYNFTWLGRRVQLRPRKLKIRWCLDNDKYAHATIPLTEDGRLDARWRDRATIEIGQRNIIFDPYSEQHRFGEVLNVTLMMSDLVSLWNHCLNQKP